MTRPHLSEASRAAFGPPILAAMADARGSRATAARALGISPRELRHRIAECTVAIDGANVPLRDVVASTWPPRVGPASVAVVPPVEYAGTGYGRERVYRLAAHLGVAAGAHVVRAPAVGAERQRVVCKVCKEIGRSQ